MLTKKSQYALYAVIHLARNYKKGNTLIKTISEKEQIPKKFLENILVELKSLGFISSKKGKGGGYFLIKPPEEINLADIIRHIGGAIALLPCVSLNFYQSCNQCIDEQNCGLKVYMKKLRDLTDNYLKSTTIADILKKEKKLKKKNKL